MSNDQKSEVQALREQVDTLTRLLLTQQAQTPGMPVDPALAKQRHAEILAKGEQHHRDHVARANRQKGHPEPKVGDVFYAWLSKTVRSGVRTREGLNFAPGQNVKIEVVADEDGDDRTTRPARLAGTDKVTVDGMERIFEDDTLVVNKLPGAPAVNADELRAENERLRAELAQRNAEAESRVDDARRGAQDPGDGTSGRLKAADRARKQAEAEDTKK